MRDSVTTTLLLLAAAAAGRADSITVAVAARSIRPGELVVLTLTIPSKADGVRVRAFDRDAPVFQAGERTWTALIGIDLDVRPGPHTVSIDAQPADRGRTTYVLHVEPKRFPTRKLDVDEAFVNPPPAMQARIEREAADLRRIWSASPAERLWSTSFVRPVPEAANSRFGTRSIFNGQVRSPHSGADFMSPSGTPIHAPNAGRIALARDLYFSGNTVVIDHGQGLFSLLAHLSALDVHEGETVAAGQVVGRVGATGRVTGPHLHWAIRLAGTRVDPLSVLELLGKPRTPGPQN